MDSYRVTRRRSQVDLLFRKCIFPLLLYDIDNLFLLLKEGETDFAPVGVDIVVSPPLVSTESDVITVL